MKGSEQARLVEINMLAEAIQKVESITAAELTEKDAFLERARIKLNKLISEFVGD